MLMKKNSPRKTTARQTRQTLNPQRFAARFFEARLCRQGDKIGQMAEVQLLHRVAPWQ